MKKTASLVLVPAVFALFSALATDEAGAQAITVTPVEATISVGQAQQFTATGISTPIALEAGAYHTCVLLEDATLRCWGVNDYGQLGDGTLANSSAPVVVAGVTGVAAVSGGGFHTCARSPDGTLRCWGRNSEGQLGDPATTAYFSAAPVPVTGITTAATVTSGGYHTCALLQNGTVRCWGQNDYGQLGDGTIAPPNVPNRTPVAVSGIAGAVAVSAGGWHTCALLQNGTVRCWGQNDYGQLGDGSPITQRPAPPTPRPTPTSVEVTGITTAVALEAGAFHTCALLQDGTMQCWGWNEYGQLSPTPAFNSSSTPVTVSGVTPAALAPGAEHTCVLLRDGQVQCWGDNGYGQLGNGSPRGVFATPGAPVSGITTATAATSGIEHGCALLRGGTVQCWGRGLFGRLGDGTPDDTDAFTPVTVVGLGATWTSSDTAVATVDASGMATGRSPGSAIITATSGGRSGAATLTVVGAPSLTVVREGNGNGAVISNEQPPRINCGANCSAVYDQNSRVTLTATPAAGSTFEGWTGGGCAGTGTCTVTLTGNTTVRARFGVFQLTLTVMRQSPGTGTVTSNEQPPRINCGASCSAVYDAGATVTLTATPAAGSTFEGWTGGGCAGTGTCTVTLTGNTTVTARFGVRQFTLSVTRQGNGTVTSISPDGRINCGGGGACSAAYNAGTVVTLRARPGLLYFFVGWSGGGCSGTGDCRVTLGANTTVTARFQLLGLF